ncbi:MAG: hypothetical protein AB9869_19275 [Verrucomicrobiia bacterium]
MNSKPRRSFFRRFLSLMFWLLILAVVVLGGLCLYGFRDRNPGYQLSVEIDSRRAAEDPRPLLAGFARMKINPDISGASGPVYLAGFSQNRMATAIHDDLWAIACVIDDGFTRVGIVSLDAIGFFHDDVITVRQRLGAPLKLDYTVICTTHNHSTPDLMGLWGPHYLKSGVNPQYREQVISAAARVLTEAVEALAPAQVAFYTIPMEPQGLVTDTRKPEVYDADVRVMHFTHAFAGTTLGTVTGWGNHPETVWSKNTEVTADFPGYLRDSLERGVVEEGKVLEPGLGGIHLFVNGAIGGLMTTSPSVTVRDPYLDRDFKDPSHDKARAVGRQLAAKILPALKRADALPRDHVPISVRARTIEVPVSNKLFLLAPVLGVIDRGHPGIQRWNKIRTETALITLGETSIACLPGEVYPELVNGGIERAPGADFDVDPVEVPPIREMMPGKTKFVFGLANDEVGYIIPKSHWDEREPYLYGSNKPPYGEVNSVGPDVAGVLHSVLREFCERAQGSPQRKSGDPQAHAAR